MTAKAHGMLRAIVPAGNGQEAGAVDGLEVYIAESLLDVCEHLKGTTPLSAPHAATFAPTFDRA